MGDKKFVSSEDLIKNVLAEYTYDSKFIAPFNESNFTEKKLMNACKTYAKEVDPMTVVGFIDSTMLGSAKEGVLFTGKAVYYKPMMEAAGTIAFDDIESAKYEEKEEKDSNGKVTKKTNVLVVLRDGKSIKINLYNEKRNKVVADILAGVCEDIEVIDSTEQLISLNDLGEEVISLYLTVIMNYLKDDDGIIDSEEYKELIGLMTRLNIKKGLSDELRMYRLTKGIDTPTEEIIKKLEESIPRGSVETIFQSLANDLILIRKEIMDDWKDNADFIKYKDLLRVSDEQVDFFIRKTKQDEAIIKEKIDDNTIKKTANELLAVGGAAGVSLAALTVTGGVSTGVWGGLLTLGLASTGGMIIGLAAIAGAGYGAYRGIKYLSGTSELEKYGIRMSMLQEKIRQLQMSQNYLIEDLNWIGERIASLLEQKEKITENFVKIQEMLRMSQNLRKSTESMMVEEELNTREVYLAQIPEILNDEKCKELLSKSRYSKQFGDFIFLHYEENEGTYKLKDDIDTNMLEKLSQVFTQIGYYDTAKSIAAQGSMLKKKSTDMIKGIFS